MGNRKKQRGRRKMGGVDYTSHFLYNKSKIENFVIIAIR